MSLPDEGTVDELQETIHRLCGEKDDLLKVNGELAMRLLSMEEENRRLRDTPPPAPSPKVDPSWSPGRSDEVPLFERVLNDVLMSCASREFLNIMRSELLDLAVTKGELYQDAAGVDSCLKRGLGGVWHNLMRKVDRLAIFMGTVSIDRRIGSALDREAAIDGTSPDTLYKTFRDFAVYAVHAMRWAKGLEAHHARGAE